MRRQIAICMLMVSLVLAAACGGMADPGTPDTPPSTKSAPLSGSIAPGGGGGLGFVDPSVPDPPLCACCELYYDDCRKISGVWTCLSDYYHCAGNCTGSFDSGGFVPPC